MKEKSCRKLFFGKVGTKINNHLVYTKSGFFYRNMLGHYINIDDDFVYPLLDEKNGYKRGIDKDTLISVSDYLNELKSLEDTQEAHRQKARVNMARQKKLKFSWRIK